MSITNSKQVSFKCLQNVVLVTAERTLVGKEFHACGPATEKALSLRRRLVRLTQQSQKTLSRGSDTRVHTQQTHQDLLGKPTLKIQPLISGQSFSFFCY